ncbi:MAG: beta-N-acetylhexosaminidase [Myxococcales bacterium]|nr:MAG: beta-N-acetylhexosaminidase [Myxococcales bacterium]
MHPGQLLFAGFEGTQIPEDLAGLVREGRVGGIVLFARNLRGPGQVRDLVAQLHGLAPGDTPLGVAIDQEGGRVQRLRAPWTEWPPMRRLGERDDLAETVRVARALALELADLGIDLDFAPVVDVDTNPHNPVIGDRSFGREPERVARHARAFIEAMQGAGVAACAKHFPGHGDTSEDSHLALPRVDHPLGRLLEVELVPFRAAARAGVASMMTAHVLLPCFDPHVPATLCGAAIELLRGEIDYDGVVFGDDFEMAAVAQHFPPREATRRALEAGVDALLVCSRADVRDLVLAELEALPDAVLESGQRRMAALKRRFAGGRLRGPGAPPYPEHARLAAQIADQGVGST